MSSKKIIGIDLGTTYSCVAYIDEYSKPVVIPNSDGKFTTPSAVYFENEENIIVGEEAKNVSKIYPDRVAEYVKRSMGDPSYSFVVDGKQYRPEEISAYILRKLVQDASQVLGEDITDVIITCPAYFGANQREATKNAGEIAGLTVHHILNEPTAAAIFFGMIKAQDNQVVLVYDLGGGTFDITVIALEDNNVNVVVTGGDAYLGGADWDKLLSVHFASEFNNLYPDISSPLDSSHSYQELLKKAEEAKISLTNKEKYRLSISHEGERATIELTREKFEELTSALLEQTIGMTKGVIEEARGKGYHKIDRIILVGGSSKMPYVSRRIKEEFGLEPQLLEPDLAVAKGAALGGVKTLAGDLLVEELARLQGVSKSEIDLDTIDEKVLEAAAQTAAANAVGVFRLGGKELLDLAKRKITNVCSKGFGIVVTQQDNEEDIVAFLIHKNTPLPAEITQEFGTRFDNQSSVELRVMEQAGESESPQPDDNTQIGFGDLVGFPTNLPAGSPIIVTFRLEEDGTLKVRGLEPSSNTDLNFDVKVEGGVMSREEIKEKRGLMMKQSVS
ncbi:MAG TPA: Hsp70 family protein [Pyrinomonadaceae bacterium]|jgi:molecular chaperone DnaK (HSP70)